MGCFSWVTQDTCMSILMHGYGPKSLQGKTYYMWDNKGNYWTEPKYEGYGVFGKKDYFVLLAEMNNYTDGVSFEEKRKYGIGLEYSANKNGILFPNLTEYKSWTWRNKQPEQCYNQGCWQEGYEYEQEEEQEEEQQVKIGYCGDCGSTTCNGNCTLHEVDFDEYELDDSSNSLSEREKIKCMKKLLSKNYTIVNHERPVKFSKNNIISQNPVWFVTYMHVVPENASPLEVAVYCQGAKLIRISPENYQKLLNFEKDNNEKIVLYISHDKVAARDKVAAHCKNYMNMDSLNDLIRTII